MKTMRFLFIAGLVVMITTPLAVIQSQDTGPRHKTDPDVRWNVRKQYDEHGNLIYYDSSCVHTWNYFDFPGPGGGNAFRDLDSLLGDLFQFPEGMFEYHPFRDFPDSAWMDSSFPDAMMPFEEFFPPSFHGPDVFFDRPKDWIEKFREGFTFPGDSLDQLHPEWQNLPRQQKKPSRGIEI